MEPDGYVGWRFSRQGKEQECHDSARLGKRIATVGDAQCSPGADHPAPLHSGVALEYFAHQLPGVASPGFVGHFTGLTTWVVHL